jgi:hypothetical protein
MDSYIEPQRPARQRFLPRAAKFFYAGRGAVAETSTSVSRPVYAFCDNAIFDTQPELDQKGK